MYKAADLRERTVDDLRELERTIAKELFTSRFKNFTNRLDDTSSLSKSRRDLARIKTVLLEKLRVSTAGAPAAAPAKKPAAKKAEAAPAPAPSKPAAAAAEAVPEAPPSKAAPKKKAAAKKTTTAKKKSEE